MLVEQYGGLVRLAYLVLPASLGRHRRVLRARSLAQRALPRTGGGARPTPGVPAPRGGGEPVAALIGNDLRVAVLRAALKDRRRAGSWAGRATAVWPPRRLPIVLGLRLFPRSGNADDMALGQVLSGAEPDTRGAFAAPTRSPWTCAPATPPGRWYGARGTAACSRFGQHVMADTRRPTPAATGTSSPPAAAP
ncbi:hypothetical protein ABTZ21_26630 [Streptomyces sp. NPDC096191]|uniref:hypothetical protein n=1 Tax=Streptomyces sp. NPDC096191 TaxID=3155426 RepID=UPI00332EA266